MTGAPSATSPSDRLVVATDRLGVAAVALGLTGLSALLVVPYARSGAGFFNDDWRYLAREREVSPLRVAGLADCAGNDERRRPKATPLAGTTGSGGGVPTPVGS